MRLSKSPRQTLLGLRCYPIRSVIDVGANVGQFARYVHTVFPQARIYCFEPLPAAFRELAAWAGGQTGTVVRTFNVALGDSKGTASMFHHTDFTPSSSLLPTTGRNTELYPFTERQEQISVLQTTLDDAIATLGEPLIDDVLVKLDVQGYEDRVIKGGWATLARARACIAEVNIEALYEGQTSFSDLLLALAKLGFRYSGNLDQEYGDDGRVIFFDTVFTRPLARSRCPSE